VHEPASRELELHGRLNRREEYASLGSRAGHKPLPQNGATKEHSFSARGKPRASSKNCSVRVRFRLTIERVARLTTRNGS
jgi:hypothetical protein